jgi:hypothetical protein
VGAAQPDSPVGQLHEEKEQSLSSETPTPHMRWKHWQAYAWAIGDPEAALDGCLSKLGSDGVLDYIVQQYGYADIMAQLKRRNGRRPNPRSTYMHRRALALICGRYGHKADSAVAACLHGKFDSKMHGNSYPSREALTKIIADARRRCEADPVLQREAESFAGFLISTWPAHDLPSQLRKIASLWRKTPLF